MISSRTLRQLTVTHNDPMTDATSDLDTDHSGQYASIETGRNCILVYDLENPNAWLKSNGSVPVRE
ncbi:hypothetical protein ACFQL7_04345 [Halocatena marina]|uniref:Uncharacterized protein n=1 Tax=Halocatena marina TaxID=2934937 RepID=A0ABD5YN12_9EURY|nr:hypothetical protein [Halocatena marina]